jgi:hypothetical protein
VSFVDEFYRDFDSAVFVLSEHNCAEGALAELLHWLVLLDALVEVSLLSQDFHVPVVLCLFALEVNETLLCL